MTEDKANDGPDNAGPETGGGDAPRVVTAPPSRRLRWLLIASLAANLLVLGMVGGAMLRHDRDGRRGQVADVGFGPFTDALNGDDRRALREAFIRNAPNFREMRNEARGDMSALIAALRADAWNPDAVRMALAKQHDRTVERIALGQDLLLQRLAAMTPDERRGFADRLEAMMRRPPKGKD